jgi:hypothetical protein
MLKVALTERENKEKIRPKIKIKIKPNEKKEIPEFYNVKEQNSNSKSNINSTKPTEVLSNNSQNNDKYIFNSMTDDKDLEMLLSELKNSSNLKSKNSEHDNFNEGDDINLNNYVNKVNLNEYLYFGKRKDNDNIDFIDFQEPGNEISQRVHEYKAKIHPPIKGKKLEQNKVKIRKNDINNINKKVIYKKTLEYESSFKNNSNKVTTKKRNSSNLKDILMKKFTSFTKNKKKILYRYQTDKAKINSNTLLDRPADQTKRCNKDHKKKNQNIYLKSNKRTLNNYPKNVKTSFVKKMRFSNKSIICSPKDYKANKSINFDSDSKGKINKIKFRVNNSCNKDMGELYIKNRYKRIKIDKIKLKLFDSKNNANISNPFENNSQIIKNSPSFQQIKSYAESFIGKKFVKKITDTQTFNKAKNINETNFKIKNGIKTPNRNYSNVNRIRNINIIL